MRGFWQAGPTGWALAAIQGMRALRHAWPASCPLCAAPVRGGRLCPGCRLDALGQPQRRTPGVLRCRWCAARVPHADAACPDCVLGVTAFDYVIVATDYAPPVDALVRRLKQAYRPASVLALGDLLADAVARDERGLPEGATLVPLPATRARLLGSGFNPAGEIARVVGEHLRLPVARDWLALRHDDGMHQHHLGRSRRLDRGRERYVACRGLIGQPVALVDDVMTTGATLDAAAAALRAVGADPIVALAVARTPPPRRVVRDPIIRAVNTTPTTQVSYR